MVADEHPEAKAANSYNTIDSFATIVPPGQFDSSSNPHTTQTFDPRKEYRKLVDAVTGKRDGGVTELDVYQKLLAKEKNVLDTVNRVVNDKLQHKRASTGIFRMPLHELCMRTISAVHTLFDDLVDAAASRSSNDAIAALKNNQRLPFLGVALVTLALFLAALQAIN